MHDGGQRAAEAVRDAIAHGDGEALRLLLHPYLRWTREDGTVLRGRRNVLAMLEGHDHPDPPSDVELRDGQVYRWVP
jgi:Domain of unknown function (DUF4440)